MQKQETAAKAVPQKEPGWLADYREKNEKIFFERPVKKSKYTSIEKIEGLLGHCKPKKIELAISGRNGIQAMQFWEALEEIPGKIREILSMEEPPKDQFEAFVNANFNSGFVLVLGKEASGKTIRLALNGLGQACTKNIIIAEEGIEAGIIEEITGGETILCSETVSAGQNSKVSVLRIHEGQGNTVHSVQNIAMNGAEVINGGAWLGTGLTKANTKNIMHESGSCTKECSVLIGKNSGRFDINYSSVHRGTDSSSHCVFKSVLNWESRAVFDGMIRIEETGQRSNALLECHSMLLSEKASSNQIPGLEIKTDDVKATHSATVARIDEEEVFYLESRGITRKDAEKMIVNGFLEGVAFMLPQGLREVLQEKIVEQA